MLRFAAATSEEAIVASHPPPGSGMVAQCARPSTFIRLVPALRILGPCRQCCLRRFLVLGSAFGPRFRVAQRAPEEPRPCIFLIHDDPPSASNATSVLYFLMQHNRDPFFWEILA